MEPRPPSATKSILTHWIGIEDANTAGMDRMTFLDPVYVGQLVTVKATVNAAWRTSVEVGVCVGSEHVAQLRRENRLAEREAILRARGGES